jgi:hypothetical protein
MVGGPAGAFAQTAADMATQPIIAQQAPVSGLLALLPPRVRDDVRSFYIYNADFVGATVLAASATRTTNVTIQADADFIVMFAMAIVTDVTDLAFVTSVPQLVMLKDTASGSFLMQSPTHFNLVYGDAQNPGIFSQPYYLRASSTLQVQHQNLEATARNVRIAFAGFRSVPRPGASRPANGNVWG